MGMELSPTGWPQPSANPWGVKPSNPPKTRWEIGLKTCIMCKSSKSPKEYNYGGGNVNDRVMELRVMAFGKREKDYWFPRVCDGCMEALIQAAIVSETMTEYRTRCRDIRKPWL